MGRKIELTPSKTKSINKFFNFTYILPDRDAYRVYNKADDSLIDAKETLQEAVDLAYQNEKAVENEKS